MEVIDSLGEVRTDVRESIYKFCYNFEKESISLADHIITVDNRLRDYVVTEFGYPADRVKTIFNAVDTDSFCPISKTEQTSLRRMLGIDSGVFLIIVPRRFVKKNGVIYAIRSMKLLPDKNVRMAIAGDGP